MTYIESCFKFLGESFIKMRFSKPKGSKGTRLKHTKRKSWKKGQSSSSNPESRKFREAAKNKFFNTKSAGEGALTVDALAKHDDAHLDKDGDVELSDARSESDRLTLGAGTFKTWATNWTDCTNMTFARVHQYRTPNSEMDRQILAILAAVTEVIKTQGGTESDTEYFSALMTILTTASDVESLAAAAYLLKMVIKKVPVPVLRSRHTEICETIFDCISKQNDDRSTSLIRSLLLCLALVLRVQDQSVWSNLKTQKFYNALLAFTSHNRPKIRKAAHDGICLVLKGSFFLLETKSPPHHPAASMTAKYCIQKVEETGGIGDAKDTLFVLNLLRDVISTFQLNSVKSVCETMLRLMTLSNALVTANCMQTFHKLFLSNPQPTTLSQELNAQIITALYDYKPAVVDTQPMQAWLAVMEKAHINLTKLDEKLGLSHLPRLFSACMSCLLSEKEEVTDAATKSMKNVTQECLGSASSDLFALVRKTPQSSTTPVHKIVKAVESGLGYAFHSTWNCVLQVFASLFEVFGKECPCLFSKALQSIASLRDSPNFAYKFDLDKALGVAVKHIGPRLVLESIPLNITGDGDDYNFSRSWLIPILRDNISNTELGFFTSYFLPLAAKFRQRAQEATETNNVVISKSYSALHLQMWDLLPGFCVKPTDLVQSFRGIAKILGTAISESDQLRMSVMSSLRKLITHSLETDECKKAVGMFAKNFLPILFNLYNTPQGNVKDPSRLACLETIKCYLQIADKQLIYSFCDKGIEKFNEDSENAFKRHALMDLMIAMAKYLDSDRLNQVFTIAKENLVSTDRTQQKKAYILLEVISSGPSEECEKFVQKNLSDMKACLTSSLAAANESSKRPRLECLINMFKCINKTDEDFVKQAISEAILCTNCLNARARNAAYGLLVEMGKTMKKWFSGSDQEALRQYFKLVMAGLAGSPQMISSTLLALTRIMFEFKGDIDSPLLESIVNVVCLLLTSKAREVVKSAISFLKVLLSAYQDVELASYLQLIMKSLQSMKEDAHHHFRFKTKEIYTKLIRKFGFETINGMASPKIQKVLINIRKSMARAKKKKAEKTEESSDDEMELGKARPETIEDILKDTDSEDEGKKKKKTKKNKKKSEKGAWLQEEGAGIIDFLDPGATQKVLATKPNSKAGKETKKTNDPGYKVAPDGRLIFTDLAADKGQELSDEDDIDELFEALEKGSGATKKAKKRKIEDIGADNDSDIIPRYKAGGKGIHRPLDKEAKKLKTDEVLGGIYRAKKAGGDVKRKGKPDPYAYVPLDFQQLNKRKSAKLKGKFNNLVKGAKKGAAKAGKKRKK